MDIFKTSNDKIGDFVDAHITKTDNVTDSIGKDEMLETLKRSFPQKC